MLISISEYEKKYGVHKQTLHYRIRKGKLNAYKKKNKYLIEDKPLDEPNARVKHGLSKDPAYRTWAAMRNRCENENNDAYCYYGGKGITICDEWQDPAVFIKWMYDNGYEPGKDLSIDRIDSNKNYCPENCRVIPRKENSILALKSRPIEGFGKQRRKRYQWCVTRPEFYEAWCNYYGGDTCRYLLEKGVLYADLLYDFKQNGMTAKDLRREILFIDEPPTYYIEKYLHEFRWRMFKGV